MAHIAFFMLPEPGHTLPSLPIARSLVSAGHTVTYISPRSLEQYFQRYGFRTYRVLTTAMRIEGEKDILSMPAGPVQQRWLLSYVFAKGSTLGDVIVEELSGLRFDALVCDAVLVRECGRVLKSKLSVPIIALGVMYPVDNRAASIADLELIVSPSEFDIPGEVLQESNRHYVEPSVFRERTEIHADDNKMADSEIVFCSLGTQTARYPEASTVLTNIVEAFAKLPSLRLLVSCGNNQGIMHAVRPLTNVSCVQTAPQLDLLQRARLFITHGGLGGVKESILAGTPMLVIPFDMDQPRNAERVKYHGAGVSCAPKQCTPDRVAALIDTLSGDHNMRKQTAAMGDIFRRYEQNPLAASLICNAVN